MNSEINGEDRLDLKEFKDTSGEQSASKKKKSNRKKSIFFDTLWNILTWIVLVLFLGLFVMIGLIYNQPQGTVNPFPPPTLPPTVALPTMTETPRRMPPTWTATINPTGTQTPIPSNTPIMPTLPGLNQGGQATESLVSSSNYPFVSQGEPQLLDGSMFNLDHGCSWMGVAGQVFDIQGRPAAGIIVQLEGVLDNERINLKGLTGVAIQYGQAGYEITLSDRPIESTNQLYVRLVDQAGLPISERVYFDTTADCSRNMILINFKQVR